MKERYAAFPLVQRFFPGPGRKLSVSEAVLIPKNRLDVSLFFVTSFCLEASTVNQAHVPLEKREAHPGAQSTARSLPSGECLAEPPGSRTEPSRFPRFRGFTSWRNVLSPRLLVRKNGVIRFDPKSRTSNLAS